MSAHQLDPGGWTSAHDAVRARLVAYVDGTHGGNRRAAARALGLSHVTVADVVAKRRRPGSRLRCALDLAADVPAAAPHAAAPSDLDRIAAVYLALHPDAVRVDLRVMGSEPASAGGPPRYHASVEGVWPEGGGNNEEVEPDECDATPGAAVARLRAMLEARLAERAAALAAMVRP